jgi:hypothetical protein
VEGAPRPLDPGRENAIMNPLRPPPRGGKSEKFRLLPNFGFFKRDALTQHLNTSTPQHLNTSTPQHLNTSTPQHLNPSTHLLYFSRASRADAVPPSANPGRRTRTSWGGVPTASGAKKQKPSIPQIPSAHPRTPNSAKSQTHPSLAYFYPYIMVYSHYRAKKLYLYSTWHLSF